MEQIEFYCKKDVAVTLIGNKSDLSDSREVDTKKAAEFAEKNNFRFFEVSSYSNKNVQDAVYSTMKKALSNCKKDYQKQKSPKKTMGHFVETLKSAYQNNQKIEEKCCN